MVHGLLLSSLLAAAGVGHAADPGQKGPYAAGFTSFLLLDTSEFFVTEKRNPNAIDQDWPGTFTYFAHQPGSEQARAEKDPESVSRVPRVLQRF